MCEAAPRKPDQQVSLHSDDPDISSYVLASSQKNVSREHDASSADNIANDLQCTHIPSRSPMWPLLAVSQHHPLGRGLRNQYRGSCTRPTSRTQRFLAALPGRNFGALLTSLSQANCNRLRATFHATSFTALARTEATSLLPSHRVRNAPAGSLAIFSAAFSPCPGRLCPGRLFFGHRVPSFRWNGQSSRSALTLLRRYVRRHGCNRDSKGPASVVDGRVHEPRLKATKGEAFCLKLRGNNRGTGASGF